MMKNDDSIFFIYVVYRRTRRLRVFHITKLVVQKRYRPSMKVSSSCLISRMKGNRKNPFRTETCTFISKLIYHAKSTHAIIIPKLLLLNHR